ncbi:unnamed protein product [Symbiodinium sp. CCMP2592]|nr:unnamed protein product [Symbiodinium sp. CCMP2592]
MRIWKMNGMTTMLKMIGKKGDGSDIDWEAAHQGYVESCEAAGVDPEVSEAEPESESQPVLGSACGSCHWLDADGNWRVGDVPNDELWDEATGGTKQGTENPGEDKEWDETANPDEDGQYWDGPWDANPDDDGQWAKDHDDDGQRSEDPDEDGQWTKDHDEDGQTGEDHDEDGQWDEDQDEDGQWAEDHDESGKFSADHDQQGAAAVQEAANPDEDEPWPTDPDEGGKFSADHDQQWAADVQDAANPDEDGPWSEDPDEGGICAAALNEDGQWAEDGQWPADPDEDGQWAEDGQYAADRDEGQQLAADDEDWAADENDPLPEQLDQDGIDTEQWPQDDATVTGSTWIDWPKAPASVSAEYPSQSEQARLQSWWSKYKVPGAGQESTAADNEKGANPDEMPESLEDGGLNDIAHNEKDANPDEMPQSLEDLVLQLGHAASDEDRLELCKKLMDSRKL